MHDPLFPVACAVVSANCAPSLGVAGPAFLVTTLASAMFPVVGQLALIAACALQLIQSIDFLGPASTAPVLFAALAPIDHALAESTLTVLSRAVYGFRAVVLIGGVAETLFKRAAVVQTAYTVSSMAIAAWFPSSVSISWLFFTAIAPAKLVLVTRRVGATGAAARVVGLLFVFTTLAGHEFQEHLVPALLLALTL